MKLEDKIEVLPVPRDNTYRVEISWGKNKEPGAKEVTYTILLELVNPKILTKREPSGEATVEELIRDFKKEHRIPESTKLIAKVKELNGELDQSLTVKAVHKRHGRVKLLLEEVRPLL